MLYLNSALSAERLPNMLGSSVVGVFGQPTTPQQVQALSSMPAAVLAQLTSCLWPAARSPTCWCAGDAARRRADGGGPWHVGKFFLVGLVLLVLGNGGFKPNISSQLGALYEPPRPTALRDRGFAFTRNQRRRAARAARLRRAPGGGGYAGFGVAGIGCSSASRRIYRRALAAARAEAPQHGAQPCRRGAEQAAGPRQQALSLLAICLLVVPFWAAYEQVGNTLPLFFRDHTSRTVLGAEVPAAWLQSLNPLVCVGFMPVLTAIWGRQARRGAEPSPLVKMSIGCALQGAAWALMAVGVAAQGPAPLVLPVAVVVILTVGELYLSPIGLAFVSGCVPPHARSTAIGFWFLSSGLAGPVAGQLGVLYSLVSKPAFFGLLAALSLANGAVLYAARHRLQRGAATHERQPLTEQQSGANSPQEGVEIEAGAGGGDRKQETNLIS